MKLTYRKDYRAPDYHIDETRLDFMLDETRTRVKSRLAIRRIGAPDAPLVLNGKYLKLISVTLDGRHLSAKDYELTDESLILHSLPAEFVLETDVEINPKANTRLSGLYWSRGILCTQCEPKGFRAITYYLDHPDCLSTFHITIHADRKKYPVLLSNGNLISDAGDTVVWGDPFKKPSYLFALIAGDFAHIEDYFKTMSGRNVTIRVYCEPGKESRLIHAMNSVKKAMKWDEERFGREYDLDLFNIVAVADFNAGAMENKGLNIFNDQVLLADAITATDANYAAIESIVAHEYFHNWSGDRVTAQDWFNLSLKEGFTVYRDQEFSGDQRSKIVQRIDDVYMLKNHQFQEDDGPLAHAVRPESFATIENFYTMTVYEKGAELIRMQEQILGWNGFRKGTDLYFSRHDGQAVTIDDFVKCMEDANNIDLSAFMTWYSTPGRPVVTVKKEYDKKSKTYTLKLNQSIKNSDAVFMIPLAFGLLNNQGHDIESGRLIFNQKEQTFTFENITEEPVLSINRFFSAPVTMTVDYTDSERLFLMQKDTDLFNRYEMGQEYALKTILQSVRDNTPPPASFIQAFGSYLNTQDPAFTEAAITLPPSEFIGGKMNVFDVDAVVKARKAFRVAFATAFEQRLLAIYHELNAVVPFSPDPVHAGRRALKNAALGYLSLLPAYAHLANDQYRTANNMTDKMAALSSLTINCLPGADAALQDFYHIFHTDHIVINKWLALQASAECGDVLGAVKKLMTHPVFSITNPNNVRALIGSFTRNLLAFHNLDGSGYAFLTDIVIQLNALNPQMAERLTIPLTRFGQFNDVRQGYMKSALMRILKSPDLSINVRETIEKALA